VRDFCLQGVILYIVLSDYGAVQRASTRVAPQREQR
jgi:hypothetical protein